MDFSYQISAKDEFQFVVFRMDYSGADAARPHSAQTSIHTLLLKAKTCTKHLPPNNEAAPDLIHCYHCGSLTQTCLDGGL